MRASIPLLRWNHSCKMLRHQMHFASTRLQRKRRSYFGWSSEFDTVSHLLRSLAFLFITMHKLCSYLVKCQISVSVVMKFVCFLKSLHSILRGFSFQGLKYLMSRWLTASYNLLLTRSKEKKL